MNDEQAPSRLLAALVQQLDSRQTAEVVRFIRDELGVTSKQSLRDAICDVLQGGRTSLREIAAGVIARGFVTTSKKFGNTCRVQLYRLDDDGVVVTHDDGTYELKPRYATH